MTTLPPRQMDIIDIARHEGRVEVEKLASRFDVTPQTIRKDLNELCDLDKLNRVHGGAVFPSNTVNLAWQSRRGLASEAKRQIARATARLIPDNSSLILNIGTTTEAVAHELLRHEQLMVVTNNLNVAAILAESQGTEVVISGGVMRKSDGGLLGAEAVDLVRKFKVDFAVIGVSAIDDEGALLDFDYREVRVSKAILEQARQKILVADSMKFQRRAAVKVGQLEDIDIFVTDIMPPEPICALCREANVRVLIAGPQKEKQEEKPGGKTHRA